MTVAQTILDQLGGSKFIAMTGSKNFTSTADGNTLYMKLVKNRSKANYLKIDLTGLDLYDMKFTHIVPPKMNVKTGIYRSGKKTTVKEYRDVMFDQLQEIFTGVTGMETHL